MHSTHHNRPPLQITAYLADDAATEALGAELAKYLAPGLVIYLRGDLGAGKTALARAMLRALGYQGKVKSPTYTLVEFYVISRLNLYHFDFYRFNDPYEWLDAGFREYFNPASVCLVEWPEKAEGLLPPADIVIALRIQDCGRAADITAETKTGRRCLSKWRQRRNASPVSGGESMAEREDG